MTDRTDRAVAPPVTMAGHAHLDLAWSWRPREARTEALDTARAVVELLGEHPAATFVMSQAVVFTWVAQDDPELFAHLVELVEQGRVEPVGGWWVEADLFGASPDSIRKQAELGQHTFESLVGRRCTVGFSPDTFGHPDWLPGLLLEAGMSTYVLTRPSEAESGLPPLFMWEGRDGVRVRVIRPRQYAGEPQGDPSGLCLYGVGNHGGGPTRAHLKTADSLVAEGVARHGSIESWAESIDDATLPVVRGHLVHHARGCYVTLSSFKDRMRSVERRLVQLQAPVSQWERLLFWQFHDVLAGTSVADVYREAEAELELLERDLAPAVPPLGTARSYVPRHRLDESRPVLARETLDEPWDGWVEARWTSSRPASAVLVEGHRAELRSVEQYGTAWRLHVLVHLRLEPGEERELTWSIERGSPPELAPAPEGVRLAVLRDGTDTWGHSLVSYGDEVDLSAASSLSCAGGPDGLIEVRGEWFERDRALKLVIPGVLLDAGGGLTTVAGDGGEQPGGEMAGPVWGRVWSYDVHEDSLRVTLRRSPPFALHDPLQRTPGIEQSWTDQGAIATRLWLEPQPQRVSPELVTL